MKSPWSSLRELINGEKNLTNSFSFKVTSDRDKRGLLAIPLRHDYASQAYPEGEETDDTKWLVGDLTLRSRPSGGGFSSYQSNLLLPVTNTFEHLRGKSDNVVIPRLNLPSLEETSWKLNPFKLMAGDMVAKTSGTAKPLDTTDTPVLHANVNRKAVEPLYQVGDNATVMYSDGKTPDYNVPTAQMSRARYQQDMYQIPEWSQAGTDQDFRRYLPRFNTQLGGGSLVMDMTNQTSSECVVEFVVLKVRNVLSRGTPKGNGKQSIDVNDIWDTIYHTVGYENYINNMKTTSYAMARAHSSGAPVNTRTVKEQYTDPITNPRCSWLPSRFFKANWPRIDPLNTASTTSEPFPVEVDSNDVTTVNTSNQIRGIPGNNEDFGSQGGMGQKTPFSVCGRGHCTLVGAGTRKVTIPLPAVNYDATRLNHGRFNEGSGANDTYPTGLRMAPLNEHSIVVLVSVHGHKSDVIEPNSTNDNIEVIGKAFTAAAVDFHCTYKEKVCASNCDYGSVPTESFNFGKRRYEQCVGSAESYTGSVLPAAGVMPIASGRIVKTGAEKRNSNHH
jgi:hypothetical protein